jgi:HlyD family secretion protein
MKRRTRTVLIVVGIVVVLAVVIGLNLGKKDSGEEVRVRTVDYGSILSRVSATGELRARFQVSLQAQVMGNVERLLVQEGDWVDRGDLLLRLDRRTYDAQLVQARSRFTQAKLSHARVESLYARELVSDEQHEASKATFEMTRAQYSEAQDRYEKTSIRAPISGTVVQVNVEEGETVIVGTMNNVGTVIMVVADMSSMQANIKVDETDVVELKPGLAAEVQVDALPDTAFTGLVTKVGYMPVQDLMSAAEEGTDFEVEVTLDSTVSELRPGMTASVDITTTRLDSVLVIPIQAMGRREFEGEEQETVFVVEDGKARLRPVETGTSSDTEIEVTGGLEQGDKVITGPYKVLSKLTDGRTVNPEEEEEPGEDEDEQGPREVRVRIGG